MKALPCKRILLKISGEALMGDQSYGIDPETVGRIVKDVQEVHAMGVDVCLVIGGGNIHRGVRGVEQGIDRSTSDYMGMLATVMNALAVQSAFEQQEIPTRVMSAIPMSAVCERYIRRRATRHLEKRRIVIFAAGSGNPYFTTDTAAALRASEMNCDLLLKGTKVDGVYSSDPVTNGDAVHFPQISYTQVLTENLKVMDGAAIALARENKIPVIVFSIQEKGGLRKIITGEGKFTRLCEE